MSKSIIFLFLILSSFSLFGQAIDKSVSNYDYGKINFQAGNYKAAISYFNQAILANSKDYKSYSARGLSYFQQKKYDLAEKDFTSSITYGNSDIEIFHARAIAYSMLKKFESAINDYTKLIEQGASEASLHYNRAKCYEQLKKHTSALADYRVFLSSIDKNGKQKQLIPQIKQRISYLEKISK